MHDAAPGLAEIDLGPVGAGVDMTPRHEELVADLACLKRARAEDEFVRRHPLGAELLHFVGKLAPAGGLQPVECLRVGKQPLQVGNQRPLGAGMTGESAIAADIEKTGTGETGQALRSHRFRSP